MYFLRQFSVKNARTLAAFYERFEKVLVALEPLWRRIGYGRLERPFAATERLVKGALFDCRMCGQCVLSETGLSCPMNCPKALRNGPCGGVRQDGGCEVYPAMRCVWVAASDGAARMRDGSKIKKPRPAVDHRLSGRSSWLEVVRRRADEARAATRIE